MNKVAEELLVQAALTGTRQIKGKYKDDENGFCAVGVLLRSLRPWHYLFGDTHRLFHKHYGISPAEWKSIVEANDGLEWDFLTIARKFACDDETESNQPVAKKETCYDAHTV